MGLQWAKVLGVSRQPPIHGNPAVFCTAKYLLEHTNYGLVNNSLPCALGGSTEVVKGEVIYVLLHHDTEHRVNTKHMQGRGVFCVTSAVL